MSVLKIITLILIISLCWFTFYKRSEIKLSNELLLVKRCNALLLEENIKQCSLLNDLTTLPTSIETIKENKLIIKHFRK